MSWHTYSQPVCYTHTQITINVYHLKDNRKVYQKKAVTQRLPLNIQARLHKKERHRTERCLWRL